MSEQLARGLFANFAPEENPFGVANGMEENLRILDDHLSLYTLEAPVAPATPLPETPTPGDGQIYTDGTYAVFNDGGWRVYPARLGVRATLLNGTEAWTNDGAGWRQFSVLDAGPAIAAAQAVIEPLVSAAETAQALAETARDQTFTIAGLYPDTAAALADAGLAVGKYFGVLSGSSSEVAIVYLKAAGPTAIDTNKRIAQADFALYGFKTNTSVTGTITPITTLTTNSNAFVMTHIDATLREGYFEKLEFSATIASGPAYGTMVAMELQSGTTYVEARALPIEVVDGYNAVTAAQLGEMYKVPVGTRFGIKMATGANNINRTVENAPSNIQPFTSGDLTGVGAVATLSTNATAKLGTPMIKVTLQHTDKVLDTNRAALANLSFGAMASKTDVTRVVRGRTDINRSRFPGVAAPAGWNMGGGVVNNGVTFAVPGNAAFARFDTNASMNYGGADATFTVTDPNAICGIGFAPQTNDPGAFIGVDGSTNTLRAYQWAGPGNNPASLAGFGKSKAIAALVSGRKYRLKADRGGLDNVYELIDSVTQAVTTLDSPFTANTHDQLNGRAGFLHLSGAANGVQLHQFGRHALFENPKIIILGDSNSWGGSLGPAFTSLKPQDWKKAWPYLLDAARGRGDVINASRPGETSSGLVSRTTLDLSFWHAVWGIIAIGTNNLTLAGWRADVQSLIASMLAVGTGPLLATLPPHTTQQALMTSMNADILGGFFGDYPVLDLAWATSLNNDRVTRNAALFLTGDVHMNVAGHAAIFNQIKIDCPFLLMN